MAKKTAQAARPAGKGTGAAPKGDAPERVPESVVSQWVGTIRARESFSSYRRDVARRNQVILGFAMCVSLLMNLYQATRTVPPVYIATNANGEITPLVTLDRPVMSDGDVASWMVNVLTKTYTLDYANYRTELAAVQPSYTAEGWKGFEKGLTSSRFLETIIGNQYVTTATPMQAPQLINSGLIGGMFAWQYSLPLQVTLRNNNNTDTKIYDARILVIRQPQTIQSDGLGIAQILLRLKN